MPDDAGRNRDASRDLPLNMRSMPDDAGGDRSAINRLTDEQMRDTDPESPFLLRPDRLLAMGVPAELVPIVDEHLGDIPSNSTEEVLAIEDIINMYSHLLEESDLSNKPVFNEVADNIGSSARPVGSGSTSNEEIERYWRAMNSVGSGSGSGSGSTSNEEFEKYKRAMGMERAD